MELQLEALFDGPPEGYVSRCHRASLDPVSAPLSFRGFTRDMLQVHLHADIW